jgi:hypothetical protein
MLGLRTQEHAAVAVERADLDVLASVALAGERGDKMTIATSGMHGFSEHGEPGDWDFGLGYVTGYRWWSIYIPPQHAGYLEFNEQNDNQFSRLIGSYNGEWKPGRIEADCARNRYQSFGKKLVHEPPEYREACGCGFWAYWDKGLSCRDIIGSVYPKVEYPTLFGGGVPVIKIPVLGAVRGTGRVIIGEKGFRSQYAEIVGLCLTDESRNQLSQWYARPPEPPRNATWGTVGDIGFTYSSGDCSLVSRDTRGYESRDASEAEVETRMSAIETVLSEQYPGARVFTDREILGKYFPQDENYGAK